MQPTRLPCGRIPLRDRKPCGTPFGEAFEQSPGTPATLPQQFDGTVGIDAVGSAAIRDVFLVRWQRPKAVLQLVDRNGDGSGNMPGVVFVGRTCIKNDHVTRAGAFEKVSHPDRLRLRSVAEVLLHESLEIRQPFAPQHGESPHRARTPRDRPTGSTRTAHPSDCRPARPAATPEGVATYWRARARSRWPGSQPCARLERAAPASQCGGGESRGKRRCESSQKGRQHGATGRPMVLLRVIDHGELTAEQGRVEAQVDEPSGCQLVLHREPRHNRDTETCHDGALDRIGPSNVIDLAGARWCRWSQDATRRRVSDPSSRRIQHSWARR